MNNTTLKVVEWDIDKLIGAEYNPRKLSEEQKQTIKNSINRFGLVDPVIVNTSKERNGIIIGGHQRTKVAREMGFEKMPCVELDLSIDQEKELNVRLNKNTGSWDNEILSDLFQKDELIKWGFGEDELEFFEPEKIEAEEYPDLGDGSDAILKTISFIVSVEQSESIEQALKKAKQELECFDEINENSNGNALNAILNIFLNGEH